MGPLQETLKWGEPAYVTAESRSGSTVRIDWKKSKPSQYAMYFHCGTNLVETFRTRFPTALEFDGNRAIVLQESDPVPANALAFCIAAALTYHRHAARRTSRRPSEANGGSHEQSGRIRQKVRKLHGAHPLPSVGVASRSSRGPARW